MPATAPTETRQGIATAFCRRAAATDMRAARGAAAGRRLLAFAMTEHIQVIEALEALVTRSAL